MPQPSERQRHWETAYAGKAEEEAPWFQDTPELSLALLTATGVGRSARLIDVGGGASRLADALLDAGFKDITVLDIAEPGLAKTKARLERRADEIAWVVADITTWRPEGAFDLWHDRALFHFLTEAGDRRAYVETLRRALAPGGHVILAAFAPDGPKECSGLPVVRYDAAAITKELGGDFSLEEERAESHVTPGGAAQPYRYFRFTRPRP